MSDWVWRGYFSTVSNAATGKAAAEEMDPAFVGAMFPSRGRPVAEVGVQGFFMIAVRAGVDPPDLPSVVNLDSLVNTLLVSYFGA